MTKRVILIRHAKSSWGDPAADDHDRVLNARGRQAAPAIGIWLRQKGYLPEVMLVSTAARTVETARLLRDQWDIDPQVHFRKALYHAGPDQIIAELKTVDAECIALVGHNPGIAFAAHALVGDWPDHPRFDDYPTCATTVIDFAKGIEPGQGTCIDFIVPRDIEGDTSS